MRRSWCSEKQVLFGQVTTRFSSQLLESFGQAREEFLSHSGSCTSLKPNPSLSAFHEIPHAGADEGIAFDHCYQRSKFACDTNVTRT
jgi:hypothetical protein